MTDIHALAIRHVLYPAWVWKNRSRRLTYLRQLERSQFWTPETIRNLQWRRLKSVLSSAYAHCPFYQRKFREAGLRPEDIRSFDDFVRVPTTSKEEIQEHGDDLLAANVPRERLVRDMTGGSTGSPLVFYYDRDRLDSREAATHRHDRWAGLELGAKLALLWGAPSDTRTSGWQRLRADLLARRLVLDASAIDAARMLDFAQRLRRFQPAVILAYANTMALFTRFLRARGIGGIRPQGIICSAELLTDDNRALIEQTFGCRVFNRYGSREFAVIASDCPAGRMHINAENLFVEVPDEGPGDAGNILVTDIRNSAMPLIRYRTDDVGRLPGGRCECGRGLPLLDLVGGRVTDFLTTTSGTQVSGIVLATYAITNIQGIRQVQFVQRRQTRVDIHIVRGSDWSEGSLAALLDRSRTFLGADMEFEVLFPDSIPLERSGKHRFSISLLQHRPA